MRARRKDATHTEVVATFKAMGCTWINIESGTTGVPDGLLGVAGRSHLIEVKPTKAHGVKKSQTQPRGSQVAWAASWRGGPIHVVRSKEDAASLVNLLRMTGGMRVVDATYDPKVVGPS